MQTFRNLSTANRQTFEDVLVMFRQKYVKAESQATAKHKWNRLVFDTSTMKLRAFLEELNQGAKKAFGDIAQKMIDSLLYAKLPRKLKRSVKMARLENGSYDENIVQHRLTPSLHPRKTTQKTSFATTPIQPTCVSPTVHQIGPSYENFS